MKIFRKLLGKLSLERCVLILFMGAAIVALSWSQLTNKPEYTVGDPGCGTLSAAITTIGSNRATLIIPSPQTITTQLIFPFTLTLKFVPGAYLDLTGLLDDDIGALSKAAACSFTVTGSNIITGVYVRPYGIRQYNDTAGEWMNLNENVYQITNTGVDTFTIPFNTSSYHTYVNTDPGRVCVPIIIRGPIIAGRHQIFKTTSQAQVVTGLSTSEFLIHKQQDWYPEWFGAEGDGSTNDLLALQACNLARTYGNYISGTVHFSAWYGVSSTFSNNNHGANNVTANFEGIGMHTSGIVGLAACSGKPVMENLGSPGIRLKSFGIGGIQTSQSWDPGSIPADAPSAGLVLSRTNANANGGGNIIEAIHFSGYFQYGPFFDCGSDTSVYRNIDMRCSALTGRAHNYWAFSLFMGSGITAPTVFPGIVGTNEDFATTGNPSADGNWIDNLVMINYGTKPAGATDIYLYKQGGSGPHMTNIGFNGVNNEYHIYAVDSAVYLNSGAGDGNAITAGIYLVSSFSPTYQIVKIDEYTDKLAGAVVILTDDNTCLQDSFVNVVRGNNGFVITLGALGANNTTFSKLYSMTAFTSTGPLRFCKVEIPYTCTSGNYSSGNAGYDNTVDYQSGGSPATVLNVVKLQDH